MRTVELMFVNRTAESTAWLMVSRASVEPIMEWYGAFYAGDDYTVTVNGVPVEQDINGERLHDTIDQLTATR